MAIIKMYLDHENNAECIRYMVRSMVGFLSKLTL